MKPEDMEAAMIRNLPEKTGRSLEEWCAVLKESGITEKRDLKKHLKEYHGVGHFQNADDCQTLPERLSFNHPI